MPKFSALLFFVLVSRVVFAQDITGSWKMEHAVNSGNLIETTTYQPDGTVRNSNLFSMTRSVTAKDGTQHSIDIQIEVKYNGTYRYDGNIIEVQNDAESLEVEMKLPEGIPAWPFNMVKNTVAKEFKKEAKIPQSHKVVYVSSKELVLLDLSDIEAKPDTLLKAY